MEAIRGTTQIMAIIVSLIEAMLPLIVYVLEDLSDD